MDENTEESQSDIDETYHLYNELNLDELFKRKERKELNNEEIKEEIGIFKL
jgi:hypothetical protein